MLTLLWSRLCPLLLVLLLSSQASAERIKDIASVNGVRSNQLIGYGLVVGLDGSGDQTIQAPFTIQSLKSMLAQLGVNIPANVNPQLTNVAAVMVHADLPAFAKPGQTIDVTVSSLGNAKSLRGGTLLMTPLKAANGETYALAQGSLLVSGFGAEGADGSRVTVNATSSGRIPNGATVERTVDSPFATAPTLIMNLNAPDFTTAQRVAGSINAALGVGTAQPIDAVSIEVQAPADLADRVAFVSIVENLQVDPASAPARVVVNSRSGTIVIGSDVRVETAAVAHGNLVVTVSEDINVSQPGAFAGGETVVTPDSEVVAEQENARMFLLDAGITLQELVAAVNGVGAAPGDLIAILEALQQAGALRAQLIVI
ncbi:MAG: flagellar biosynthesis protein FlgI [Haliea sp.]|jgi:flagellar P-ring protein precursor FlgI|uniref:flagellar basal body P-ring protein FlgI n=1 Tax=Haliea sp. TaxID=1932666 RepID=UPI000C3B8FC9|nr:flagellar basal body P-ring protein FlgI [Haliea sp.]MBM70518.1 flagellar biosynthesis protein FlgI [Haliea sp.]